MKKKLFLFFLFFSTYAKICEPPEITSARGQDCLDFITKYKNQTRGLISGHNNDPSWYTYIRRIQACASLCLEVNCAKTVYGAFNFCGACITVLKPYNPNLGPKCTYDSFLCCQGSGLRGECVCPYGEK